MGGRENSRRYGHRNFVVYQMGRDGSPALKHQPKPGRRRMRPPAAARNCAVNPILALISVGRLDQSKSVMGGFGHCRLWHSPNFARREIKIANRFIKRRLIHNQTLAKPLADMDVRPSIKKGSPLDLKSQRLRLAAILSIGQQRHFMKPTARARQDPDLLPAPRRGLLNAVAQFQIKAGRQRKTRDPCQLIRLYHSTRRSL